MNVDFSIAIELDHAFGWLDRERWMRLQHLDRVLKLNGSRTTHSEAFGHAFADGQHREAVVGRKVVGGKDRVGMDGHY